MTKRGLVLVMLVVTGLVLLAGCATTLPAIKPIRISDITAENPPKLPMLFEFKQGEKIPLKFFFHSNLVDAPTDTPAVVLTVKRDFFLYFSPDGPPRISLDGKTVLETPGALEFGFSITEANGPEAKLDLKVDVKE